VRFRNLLSDLSGERIVILSTHIVSDVEATATDIALIAQGTLVVHALRKSFCGALRQSLGVGCAEHGADSSEAEVLISSTTRRSDGVHVRVLGEEPPQTLTSLT